jgi:hypothetical protein
MSSLNTLSADRLVHVIIEQNGKRTWFHHTDRRRDDRTGQFHTLPIVDDDPRGSSSMSLAMALVSQRRWRELGIECRLCLEPNGPYIDPDPKATEALPWPHKNALISVDEQGNILDSPDAPCVYLVRAVNTPNGPMFCLRFEAGVLQNQAQFSTLQEGPEIAVRRAIEKGYNRLEKPQPNPYVEIRRREAERRAAEQATRLPNNLRPGDR